MGVHGKIIENGSIAQEKVDSTFSGFLSALKIESEDLTLSNTITLTKTVGWMNHGSSNMVISSITGVTSMQPFLLIFEGTGSVSFESCENVWQYDTIVKYNNIAVVSGQNISKTPTPNYVLTNKFISVSGSTTGSGLLLNENGVWLNSSILSGNTTPLSIKDAPGTGLVLDPRSGYMIIEWEEGRTSYSGSTVVELKVGSTIVATCDCLGSSSKIKIPFVLNTNVPETNMPMTLSVQTQDPTDGDFHIEYSIDYIIKTAQTFPSYLSPPLAPTGVYSEASGIDTQQVYWTAPISGDTPTGYKIERSDNDGVFNEIVANTNSTDTIYADTGVTSGSKVKYRITGINAGGTGSSNTDTSEQGRGIYGSTTNLQARRAQWINVDAGSLITAVSMYINPSVAVDGYYAIYDDENGLPGRKLGDTESFNTGTPGLGWFQANLKFPVSINYAQKIWLAYVFSGDVTGYFETVGTNEGRAAAGGSNLYAAGMPERFDANGTTTLGTANYSMKISTEQANYVPLSSYNFNETTLDTNEVYVLNSSSVNWVIENSTNNLRFRRINQVVSTAWGDYIRSHESTTGSTSVSARVLTNTNTGDTNAYLAIGTNNSNYAGIYRHDNGQGLLLIRTGGTIVYGAVYSGKQFLNNHWKIEREVVDSANHYWRFYCYNEDTRVWDQVGTTQNIVLSGTTPVYGFITGWMQAANVSGGEMRFDHFRFDPFIYKTRFPRPNVAVDYDFKLDNRPWADSTYPDEWQKAGVHTPGVSYVEEHAEGMRLVRTSADEPQLRTYGFEDALRVNTYYKLQSVKYSVLSGSTYFAGNPSTPAYSAAGTYENWFRTNPTWNFTLLRSGNPTETVERKVKIWEE